MENFTIIGISRGNEYSPNHVGNDSAIYNKVAEFLQQLGCTVSSYTEKEFVDKQITGRMLFNMARDKKTILRLKELEDQGALVVNSGYGISNCIRKQMTELLLKNKIPHPESLIITIDEFDNVQLSYPCWIKRGDSHAMVKDDVCYVICEKEANLVFDNFRTRNIPTAVINEHLEGDLIKFYGVYGTEFFYWFYPSPASHSKFGLESINGEARGIPFNIEELKKQCDRASTILNVPIYGGDCVVLNSGEVKIIDFNDWPSFARCKDEAGKYIAAYIYERIKKYKLE